MSSTSIPATTSSSSEWTCMAKDVNQSSFTPIRIIVQSGQLECLSWPAPPPPPVGSATANNTIASHGCVVLTSLSACRLWLQTQHNNMTTGGLALLLAPSPSTKSATNDNTTTSSQRATWILVGAVGTLAVLCVVVLVWRWHEHVRKPPSDQPQTKGMSDPHHTIIEPNVMLAPCMFQSTRRRQPRRPAILPSSITRQVACWGIHPTAALQTIRVLHRGLHCVVHAGVFNQQTVAVKSLHSTSSRSIQSFVDEIKLVCSLDSPFLLQAVGVRVRDLHLVVEFMDLGDLQTHLLLHVKRASWPSKLKWARAAARALAHLHGVHVLHRHVKSRHILLHSSGRAVLAGLGNAVSTLAASTTTSPPSSTPHGASFRWMAPEVVASRAPYTAAADVFSLGVVLWELDSLLTPYAREQAQFGWGDVHLMRQIQARRVTLAFSTECPGGVVRVALQCLSADPTRRPTAAQVVDMLSQQDIATAFDTVPTLYH